MKPAMKPTAAYYEDCNDDDVPDPATRKAAVIKNVVSREKEPRAKEKKPRKPEAVKTSRSAQYIEELPLRQKVIVDSRETKLERRTSTSGTRSPRKSSSSKPPRRSSDRDRVDDTRNHYAVEDKRSYYGADMNRPVISQPVPPARPHPRSTQSFPERERPLSYHGGHADYPTRAAPPLSNALWFANHGQSVVVPHGYQTAPPVYTQGYGFGPPPDAPPYGSPADTYFQPSADMRRLADRFDPTTRSHSAFGHRPLPAPVLDSYNGYESASEAVVRARRDSIREPMRPTFDDGYEQMPPPSHRPRRNSMRPAKMVEIEYQDYTDTEERHRPPLVYRDSTSREITPARPRYRRESVSYAGGSEAVALRKRRSVSSSSTPQNDYESKYDDAAAYQQEVAGQPMPLTAESLSKQQRRVAGSSRSSSSREDSEWKRSTTTRTSGSGSNSENVVIRLLGDGKSKVNIGGAEIDLMGGAELSITRHGSLRGGDSERGSQYSLPALEDRKSRVGRPKNTRRDSSVSTYHQPRIMYEPY